MKNFEVKNEKQEVKYSIYKKNNFDNIDTLNFLLQDLGHVLINKEHFPEILYISEIFIEKHNRNKGYGSEILQKLIKENEDKLIIVSSCLLKREFKTQPTNETYDLILNKLNKFFTKNGFINVNKRFGQYEYREAFIYNNEIFKNNIL